MRRLAVIVALLAAACGGATKPKATTHVLTITDTLTGNSCDVAGTGFEDMSEGAPVTVRDSVGRVIAATTLPARTQLNPATGNTEFSMCFFTMRVRVPDTAFYQVQIGSKRGTVTFPRRDLQANHWHADLKLSG